MMVDPFRGRCPCCPDEVSAAPAQAGAKGVDLTIRIRWKVPSARSGIPTAYLLTAMASWWWRASSCGWSSINTGETAALEHVADAHRS